MPTKGKTNYKFAYFLAKIPKNSCNNRQYMLYLLLRRRGETGRRAGLKILWTNPPCRFESDRRHQTKKSNLNGSVFLYFQTLDLKQCLALFANYVCNRHCVADASLLRSLHSLRVRPPTLYKKSVQF